MLYSGVSLARYPSSIAGPKPRYGGMQPNGPEMHQTQAPEAPAAPYAQHPWPAPAPEGPPPESSKRVRPVRDAWLLVGIGVIVPVLALCGAIWAVVQAANGERRAVPIAVVGFTAFVLRMALYWNP
jgi:hypothetical protein